MTLKDLIQNFEVAKQKAEQLLKKRRMVLQIFRVEEEAGHFRGDGFFYGSPNRIFWKYGMAGHDEEATPQSLLESYKHYKQKDIKIEDALTDATQKLNEWCEKLQVS